METDQIIRALEARCGRAHKTTKYVTGFLLPNGVPLAVDNRTGRLWLLDPVPAVSQIRDRSIATKNSNLNGPWKQLGDPTRASMVTVADQGGLQSIVDHYSTTNPNMFEINDEVFQQLIDRFKQNIPDFTNLRAASETYFIRERLYKDRFLQIYGERVMARIRQGSDLDPATATDIANAFTAALVEKIPGENLPQNMLGWRHVQTFSELAKADPKALADALMLVTGVPAADAPEALERAARLLTTAIEGANLGRNSAGLYAGLTLHLSAQRPAELPFVRASMVAEATDLLLGSSLVQTSPVAAGEYRNVIRFYRQVFERLQRLGWNPADLWDAHNFLWVALGGWDEPARAPDATVPLATAVSGNTDEYPVIPPEMTVDQITEALDGRGLVFDRRIVARYAAGLGSRRFVILAGDSGIGKTRLAAAYADIIGARREIVPVAPNWTSNEDLLGFLSPLDDIYRETQASSFLREAAFDWKKEGGTARDYHLILDEMNLARVEHYFARLLSAMEMRDSDGSFRLEIAPGDVLVLGPNFHVIGTVNIDETTHGFADKVYDRAQTIELEASEALVAEMLKDRPWADVLMPLWRAGVGIAPFAFRTLVDIERYIDLRQAQGDRWEEALDEQILQKVLPKAKGADLRIAEFLQRCADLCDDRFPLSQARAKRMLSQHREQGFASYF